MESEVDIFSNGRSSAEPKSVKKKETHPNLSIPEEDKETASDNLKKIDPKGMEFTAADGETLEKILKKREN
jgi:hypothetical protein